MARPFLAGLSAIVIAGASAWTASAHADQAQDELTSESTFNEGNRAAQGGDWVKARDLFRASIAAKRSVGAYINLARALEQLGALAESHSAYESAADLAVELRDDREAVARAAASRLEERLGAIRLSIGGARPAAPVVTIDDRALATSTVAKLLDTGALVWVDPGRHALRITSPETEGHDSKIEVAAGERVETTVILRPIPRPVPRAVSVTAPSERRTSPLTWLGPLAAGVGAATAIAGGLFGVAAIDARDEFYAKRDGRLYPTEGDYTRDRDSLHTTATTATVLIGVGAALVVAGVAMVLLAPGRPSGTRDRAAARLGPWGVSLPLR